MTFFAALWISILQSFTSELFREVTDMLHAMALVYQRKKKFKVRFYRGLRLSSTCALGWLTNECFAFTSSSTFIPHKLKSPTKLLQEFDRVEDAFIFYWTMLTQSYMSCGFVKLLVLCDQVWLSHWTRLPVKPEPVVKFSLKWKGNTVCLPKVWITI